MHSSRRGRVLSLALGALGLGTAVASAVRTQIDDAWAYSAYDPVPLNIAVAVFFSAMGVLVSWHEPGNVLGWTMLVIAAWAGVGVLLTVLTGASGSPVLMWVQAWLWAPPIWAVTTLLPMIYPDGRLPSRRWWWAVALAAAGTVVYCAGLAFEDADFAGRQTYVNPLARPSVAEPLLTAGEYLLHGATVLAVGGLVWRWLRASGVHRRRITLLLCAFGFGAVQAVVRDSISGQLPPEPAPLSKQVEVAAYRIVAEALTNVVRHAQATRAEITVTLTDGRLAVAVRDDGVGVPPDAGRNGMGLRFMAQRAREIDGEFSCSSDERGTAVRAVLPAVTPDGRG